MEAGRSLISSSPQFPLRAHFRNSSYSSSSSSFLVRHPPTSVLIQDHRSESRTTLSLKEDSPLKQTMDERLVVVGPTSSNEKNRTVDPDKYLNEFQRQLPHRTELWYLWPSLHRKDFLPYKGEKFTGSEADHVVAFAREALSVSQEAASISQDTELFGADLDDYFRLRGLVNVPPKNIVRSKRLLDKQAKKRGVPKPKVEVQPMNGHKKPKSHRKFDEGFGQKNPVRLFLSRPETRQLLTAKEESKIIVQIQELMKLQEQKSRLQALFSREPTLVEWAAAVGISCQALQSQVQIGNSSREKLIYANFRMVVHIAKRYEGHGLSLQDLLQEGSMGLMKSVEKFKPEEGCRFATYAYWWIRQSIKKALFRHSRTIRLPESVHALLAKVSEAKKKCIQKGNPRPMKKDIAACAGMTVEKLEQLLCASRRPFSMERSLWMSQDTTFQEITADTRIELPDIGASKQFMRQHVRNLLSVLNPRERKLIRLRFGIEDGQPKTLSEIGDGFGLTKERIRQLENQALCKLRECLESQELEAYTDLLV